MVSWLVTVGSSARRSAFTLLLKVFLIVLISSSLPTAEGFRVLRQAGNRNSPIVLVPGDGGSQLEAKLDKPSTVHYYCEKKTDSYYSLWLNLELLFPYILDCWVDNMRLVYDNVTRRTSNSPGVDIRVPGFGNTSNVEWLDSSKIPPSLYFFDMVQSLVALNYTRSVDIRGAPYDYRRAPNEMEVYYASLKILIEEIFSENNDSRVTIVCHSMGCPVTLYFFNHQPQEWKDHYVKAFITLGGAWGGAVKALKAFASGETLGMHVNHLTVRLMQRSSPSFAYMTPFDTLWDASEVLVQTPTRNYSVGNLQEFFQDIKFPQGWEMRKDTYNLTRNLEAPGVEIHCLHGVNQTTIAKLLYKSAEFPDSNPTTVGGDGDGTVNLRSLEGCLRFRGHQKQSVFHVPLQGVDHMGILTDKRVLAYIAKVAQEEQ